MMVMAMVMAHRQVWMANCLVRLGLPRKTAGATAREEARAKTSAKARAKVKANAKAMVDDVEASAALADDSAGEGDVIAAVVRKAALCTRAVLPGSQGGLPAAGAGELRAATGQSSETQLESAAA